MLPKHTPLDARKELSRKLHAAKAEKRLALGVDAETLRWRAMHPWTTFSDKFGPEIERIEAMNDTARKNIEASFGTNAEQLARGMNDTPITDAIGIDHLHATEREYALRKCSIKIERENNALRARESDACDMLRRITEAQDVVATCIAIERAKKWLSSR